MSEKGRGLSPNDTRGGKRTVSPSHKVIDPVKSGEVRLRTTPRNEDEMKDLIADLRNIERMGKNRK
jgi:hypothetical protein